MIIVLVDELQRDDAAADLTRQPLQPPRIAADRMIPWIADWVRRGGQTLGKPTHFEVRDGRF